jgi:hypothetical protein
MMDILNFAPYMTLFADAVIPVTQELCPYLLTFAMLSKKSSCPAV